MALVRPIRLVAPLNLTRGFTTAPRSITLPTTPKHAAPRTLSYHESGSPTGSPVLYIHGTPDSRVAIANPKDHEIASRLGVRWIGIDRPGIGDSDAQPGRSPADWAADVQVLLDKLGLERVRVVSVSGGTAHALACAQKLGDRLDGVAIVAGVGPWAGGLSGMSRGNRLGLYVWRYAPWLFRRIYTSYLVPLAQDKDPTKLEEMFRTQLEGFEPADRAVLREPVAFKSLIQIFQTVYKHGVAGHVEEMRIVTGDWGFKLEDVGYEGIKLWYAKDDVNTPVHMGEYMQKRLPGARLDVVKGSHFTIWKHIEEILGDLLGKDKSKDKGK